MIAFLWLVGCMVDKFMISGTSIVLESYLTIFCSSTCSVVIITVVLHNRSPVRPWVGATRQQIFKIIQDNENTSAKNPQLNSKWLQGRRENKEKAKRIDKIHEKKNFIVLVAKKLVVKPQSRVNGNKQIFDKFYELVIFGVM